MFREFGFLVVFLVGLVVPFLTASSRTANESYKIVDGLAVYLGGLPAAMIQGHSADHPEVAMHGGIPRGPHIFHIMVALFDAKSGDRIEDAGVEAQVSPPGLAGTTRWLEAMAIVGTITYGIYFRLDPSGPYRIRLAITPRGARPSVSLEFTYEHDIQ